MSYGTTPPEGGAIDFQVLPAAAHLPRMDVWQDLEPVRPTLSVDESVARDPHPIPQTNDREGYFGPRHFAYWHSGLYDYYDLTGIARRHGVELREGESVFEFGCASGRTLRHFACQHPVPLDLWGSDIAPRNVAFCQKFLPSTIKVFRGSDAPPVPLESGSVSFAFALSVFTHIDDFETAWLAEIRRLLRPGGVAVLTIHTERLWTRLDEKIPVYNYLKSMVGHPQYPVDISQFQRPMHAERVVFRLGPAASHTDVFHSDAYIHRVWGRYFEILEIIDGPPQVQAQVVVRKAHARS